MEQLKHLENTFATYVYSHCNICSIQTKCLLCLKQLKYLKYIFATHVYSHYNITYATPDLLLQHLDETYATYIWNAWNIRLQHVLICLLSPNEGLLTRARGSAAWGARHEVGPGWGAGAHGTKQVRREAQGHVAQGAEAVHPGESVQIFLIMDRSDLVRASGRPDARYKALPFSLTSPDNISLEHHPEKD
jgi:hypothetical protein